MAYNKDPRGLPGVLVCCQQTHEKKALWETRDLITEYVAKLYPSRKPSAGVVVATTLSSAEPQVPQQSSEAAASSAPAAPPLEATAAAVSSSVAEEIAAELASLEAVSSSSSSSSSSSAAGLGEKRKRTEEAPPLECYFREFGRAVGLVWVEDTSVDMVRVVNAIMADLLETKQAKTKRVIRLIPLQRLVPAFIPDLVEAIGAIIKEHFPRDKSYKWAFEFGHRFNELIKRNAMSREVALQVGNAHCVDLKHPEITVVVEVCGGVAGVAVIPHKKFAEYSRYNVQLVGETTEDREARLRSVKLQEEALAARKQRASAAATARLQADQPPK